MKSLFKGEQIGSLIAKTASGWLLISVAGAGVALLSQIVLARVLGVTEYGWYVLYLAWVQILVVPAVFGFDTAVLKYTSMYYTTGSWGPLRGVVSFSGAIVFVFSLIMIAGVFVVVKLTNPDWPLERQNGLMLALVLIPVLSLTPIAAQVLRGLKRVLYSAFAMKIFRPAFLLIGVYICDRFYRNIGSANDAVMINIAGATVAMLGLILVAAFFLPRDVFKSKPVFHIGSWSKVALPMVFMSGMYILLGKVDIVMLGQLTEAADVGVYSATSRLTALVGFGLGAVNSIAAPLLAEHFNKNEMKSVQQTLSWSARLATIFTVLAAIFLIILGDWLLAQFGAEFARGRTALMILMVGALANALAGSVGYMMIMGGQQKKAAAIVAIALVVNIGLNFALIPRFGIVGASIATAIATILWNVLMYTYVKVKWDLNASVLAGKKRLG